MNDGIIKFECDWLKAKPLELNLVKELNRWREKMYCLELIGAYPS